VVQARVYVPDSKRNHVKHTRTRAHTHEVTTAYYHTLLSRDLFAGAVDRKTLLILWHQYWLISTVTGLMGMICGRIAATRYFNQDPSVWYCAQDVIVHGLGTASAGGFLLAPFKLLDMLFRRMTQSNNFVWHWVFRQSFALPWEIEIGMAVLARSMHKAGVFKPSITILVISILIPTMLFVLQRAVTWILEQYQQVRLRVFASAVPHSSLLIFLPQITCYIAGISCQNFQTSSQMALK
jgi:hypothetical protein